MLALNAKDNEAVDAQKLVQYVAIVINFPMAKHFVQNRGIGVGYKLRTPGILLVVGNKVTRAKNALIDAVQDEPIQLVLPLGGLRQD